jgi:hypothetical protein
MFGDEDLEMGDVGIRPENSDNINVNLCYRDVYGADDNHSLTLDAGFVWRDTRDYIQRNIVDVSGGKSAATYINYGKVRTWGLTLSARYSFAEWISIGGNLSYMDVRDNMKIAIGTVALPNLGYGDRMPNIPYLFADSDIRFTWRDAIFEGDQISVSYDNQYLHNFHYYSSRIGTNKDEYMVPSQLSHNLSLGYSLKGGKYNIPMKEYDPYTVSFEEVLPLYQAKIDSIIADWDEIMIINGAYGPYIKGPGRRNNVKIPKELDPKKITLEKAKEMLENKPKTKKKSTRRGTRGRKKTAKK